MRACQNAAAANVTVPKSVRQAANATAAKRQNAKQAVNAANKPLFLSLLRMLPQEKAAEYAILPS